LNLKDSKVSATENPKSPAFLAVKARGFGPLLVSFQLTQKLVSIVMGWFKSFKGRSDWLHFCP
jgi:hypothetical protein